jgi:hypothetical protein
LVATPGAATLARTGSSRRSSGPGVTIVVATLLGLFGLWLMGDDVIRQLVNSFLSR